jgi:hypothetical protein
VFLCCQAGNTWYFSLHARAVANNEADQMVALAGEFASCTVALAEAERRNNRKALNALRAPSASATTRGS